MAWECRLGYTKRLCAEESRRKLITTNLLIFLFIVMYTISVDVVSSFEFNCDPVKNCFCNQGTEDGEWEIQCPRQLRESFDITLKVKPLTNGGVYLTVVCDPEKPEMALESIQGVNFNKDEAAYNVTEVLLQYCSASSSTNPHVLKSFFTHVNLSLEKIKRFVFLPSPRFSTNSLMLEHFITLMPNLVILDLQRLNLTTIPDLSKLTQLKELKLRDNLIVSIDSNTFNSTKTLLHLDLSLNKITIISNDVFPQSLQYLNLAQNNIENISRQSLTSLKSLQQLVLTRNPLYHLHRDAFADLTELTHLQIDSSKFIYFPKLHNLSHLFEINISYRDDEMGEFINAGPMKLVLRQPTLSEGDSELKNTEEFQCHVSDMPNLSKIVFTNDGLTTFPQLENIPNLSTLMLNGNKIKTIPPTALSNFPKLKILNLSDNDITTLGDIGTPNLINLDMGKNQLEELSSSVFAKLTKLEFLQLSMNKIRLVDAKTFKSLTQLMELDLSHNFVSFEEDKSSEDFIGGGGDDGFFLTDFDYQSPLRFCMKLQRVDLSYNLIQTIFNDWKFLFGDLRSLNLSHNSISYLHATMFSFSTNDLTLDLSRNDISNIAMEHADLIIEDAGKRVLRVIVDENPLNCDCNILAFKTFRLKGVYFKYMNLTCSEPRWLQEIQFRDVLMTDLICPVEHSLGCPLACDCWSVPANDTIAVDCSYRNIGDSSIPDVQLINGKWTERFDYTLNLAGNNISDLAANRTKNLTSRIVKVDLSENELTSLAFFDNLINNNVTSFYLAKNKFSCNDCNFHKILRSNFKRVPDYNNVSCLFVTDSGNGQKQIVQYYADEFPEDQVCMQMAIAAEVQAMIVASSVFLVCMIIFIAVYFRYGWALRAFLYSKGFGCCFGVDDTEDEEGKTYDAFVSYSHKDEDWVLSQLVTRLEDQEGFKLCLHFRDWTPGDWIPDQIVRSVDKSRRTVVILSKHFVESIWSRLEFKAAHSQALNEKANRLILVMMDDDLKDQDVKDDDLRVYMKMNTYLKYDDPWFWHKLKYALPHKKSTTVEGNYLKQQQRQRAIQLDKLRTKMENTIA